MNRVDIKELNAYHLEKQREFGLNGGNMIPKHLQTMMKELAIENEVESSNFFANLTLSNLEEVEENHGMKVIH